VGVTINKELLDQLYSGVSPYSNITSLPDKNYPHTNILDVVIDRVLTHRKPKFWLEVGTMLGGSAIKVAHRIKALGLDTQIVCIDPFTGDVNMWDWERRLTKNNEWRFLGLKNGKPTIYDRFLANVVDAGYEEMILPIQCTSIVGMRLLQRLRSQGRISMLPEAIYLDSAHELDETLIELRTAWQLLPEGGVLLGDDWNWAAVRTDVTRFAAEINVKIQTDSDQWLLWK
jgi:hypothetical protein